LSRVTVAPTALALAVARARAAVFLARSWGWSGTWVADGRIIVIAVRFGRKGTSGIVGEEVVAIPVATKSAIIAGRRDH
jgi:hypothetical protein